MNGLERELRALAADVEWPATPDFAARPETREAARRSFAWRRTLALAAVALAVAVGAVLALSPGARSAFLELFGIGGATVARVDVLPDAERSLGLELGERVPFADAQRAVPFRILVPPTKGVPRAEFVRDARVFLDRSIGSGAVSFTWPCCEPRLVLTQFRGEGVAWVEKWAAAGTEVESVSVDGNPGIWVEGAPHVAVFRDDAGEIQEQPRLVDANVLLWERDGVTYRLEGDVPLARALAIARGLG